MNPVLISNNPELAKVLERYEPDFRTYDFDKGSSEQSRFYELVSQLAKLVAMQSHSGSIDVSTNDEGITSITINAVP